MPTTCLTLSPDVCALAQHAGYEVEALYTFGDPRCGTKTFATAFDTSLGPDVSYRVVHYADIVPHLPPMLFDFWHVSTEVWYQEDNVQYVHRMRVHPALSVVQWTCLRLTHPCCHLACILAPPGSKFATDRERTPTALTRCHFQIALMIICTTWAFPSATCAKRRGQVTASAAVLQREWRRGAVCSAVAANIVLEAKGNF